MRLHRLEITAFGAFADTAVVDFDALGTDGLFLLHGQTGAGKTTVLDAIAFALYGTVPGVRREAKRLHSDHADVAAVPNVVLEATIGGRRLRLSRSPEHQRPSRRGNGLRKINAKAALTWLDGKGHNLTRIGEIGDEVNRLLGMSADQFFQVVLLPQGEFARFLRADTDDREKLLERLFDTARFGVAEQHLAAWRRDSASSLDGQVRAIERLSAQICGAAGLPGTETGSVAWAQELLVQVRTAAAHTESELARHRRALAAAAGELSAQRRVADLQRRATDARAVLAGADTAASRLQALRTELRAAQRAAPLAAVAEDRDRAAAAAARAQRRHAEAVAQLREPAPVDDPAGLDAAIESWTTTVGVLDEVIADEERAAHLHGELERLAAEFADVRAQIGVLTTREGELPSATADVEDRLAAAVAAAAAVAPLRAEREARTKAARAAVELTARRRELAGAHDELRAARDAHADARERVLELRERRLRGIAGELAAELRAGAPCQVCGAVEHPAPAVPGDGEVTVADERAAVAAERHAGADRDAAAAAVAAIERAVDVLVERGGDADPEQLATDLAAAAARLAAAETAGRAAKSLRAELDTLRAEAAGLAQSLRELDARATAVTERQRAVRARLAEYEARRVDVERMLQGGDAENSGRIADVEGAARAADVEGTADTARTAAGASARHARTESAGRRAAHVGQGRDARYAQSRVRRTELTAAIQAARDVRNAVVAARAAQQRSEDSAARLAELAVAQGFADAAAGVAAVRTDRWQRAAEDELDAAARRTAHARGVLDDADVVAATGVAAPDLEALEATHIAAAAAVDRAVAEHADARRRADDVETLVAQLWAAADRLAPMQARHDELAEIADLVAGRGTNSRRMSLRSYVLAARLEEVALAGSVRLRRMSGGRYEFVHTDAAGARGKRGGLGLDVRDDYTGSVRSAKTLSGGETFIASLALALGLADVVAAESGGLLLDTMFIDEGFGTLDEDTLDLVMSVLDELREAGRVVGIVSHVDEMRQRIPSRLHVIRGRTGSRLQVQVAG